MKNEGYVDESVYNKLYKEELVNASKEQSRKNTKKLLGGLLSISPLGALPYRAQLWIKKKAETFSPKIASITSAAYLAALGAYLFTLPAMDFSQVSSSGPTYWGTFSSKLYDFTISSALFQTVGAYLMLDGIRAPISYLKRPFGTIISEAGLYLGKKLGKLMPVSEETKKTAELAAKKRLGVLERLDDEAEHRYNLRRLNELQSKLYSTVKADPIADVSEIKTEVNSFRKKVGLEELL